MSGSADPPVAALILAAGLGSRFGTEAKLLADFGGTPMVGRVAEAALASRARPVLAVLGARREAVAAALSGLDVSLLDNPLFADGLSTSLQAGFSALPASTRAVAVLLADMPLVSPALIDGLVEAWLEAEPLAVVPSFRGARGNPVVLSRALEPEIMALTGDHGAGPLLRGRAGVREVAIEDPVVLADVDTPEALERARALSSDAARALPRAKDGSIR
jgi:molybdenum cofactor cytidylyltransferase